MPASIAIIGAGYSGALTAVNLARHGADRGLRLTLIGRQPHFGRGLAYGTWDDNLLLNVPAGNMSALAGEPGHFLDYCRNIDPHFNSGTFLPRRIYGDYLEDTLRAARDAGGIALDLITAEVSAVRRNVGAAGWWVSLADGRRIHADRVVLALGHSPPRTPRPLAGLAGTPNYVANPWDGAALDRIASLGTIALLGAGHTAIDTLFRLSSRGADATCYLLSRHGLLPHGHRLTPKAPPVGDFPEYMPGGSQTTVRACLHALRGEVRSRQARGGDWRDVLNELRPHTPRIWAQWDLAQRRRFLDRLRSHWDVHRHRLAPSAHLRLARLIESGQVQRVAGRIAEARWEGGQIVLNLLHPATGATTVLRAAALVNCTGPEYDIERWGLPLVQQLRDDGMLTPDALRLGIQVDEGYRVVGQDAKPVSGLFYVGPMLRAAYWEAIAVPELRVHCDRLARALCPATA